MREDWAVCLKTRVGVDLYQPNVVQLVDHEIQPKYLKVVQSSLRVNVQGRCMDRISGQLLHFRVNLPEEVKRAILFPYKSLKFFVGDFVGLLVLAVIGQVFLDCIVGQMNASCAGFQSVLGTCGANIAVTVPISLHDAVAAVQHHVVPDIELPSLVEQWSFYVLLKDVGLQAAIVVLLLGLEDGFDLVEVETDCDSVATIGVLSRFDDPSIELMD